MILSEHEALGLSNEILREEIERFGKLKQGEKSYVEWRESLTDPNGFRSNPDFSGTFLNVKDGLRVVPQQPLNHDKDVVIVGGSTVFCRQNMDSETLPGILQRLVLTRHPKTRVTNFGVIGGTVIERGPAIRGRLSQLERPLLLVYFGVNECWHTFLGHLERRTALARFLTAARDKLRICSTRGPRILGFVADLIYLLQNAIFGRRWFKDLHVIEVELQTVVSATKSWGGDAIAILQPSVLTTESDRTEFAKRKFDEIDRLDRWLVGAQLAGYKELRQRLSQFDWFVDGSGWLDNQTEPVYIDWCHLSRVGNEVVAARLLELYSSRSHVETDSEGT